MNTDDGSNGQDDFGAAPPPPPPPPADPAAGTDVPPPPPRVALGPDGAVAVTTPTEKKPFWQRIPRALLVVGVIVVVLAVVGWIAGRGKTAATDLQAGDCFEAPEGTGDIRDVKDQSCDGLHDVEIVAVTSLPADAEWPGNDLLGLTETPAGEACFNAIDPTRINVENVPDDTLEGHFFPDRDAWDDGDRKILCYAQSAQGFPGPVIDRD